MILPASGLTTMFHLGVITTRGIARVLDVRTRLAYSIIAIIVGTTGASAFGMVHGAFSNGVSNFLPTASFSPCTPFQRDTMGDKKVVIRVDDIQANAYVDTQLRMMEDAFSRNIPLLLGVIPNHITEDPRIYNYLKSHGCKAEVALHGWDHNYEDGSETAEFGELSELEAYDLITKGMPPLEEIVGRSLTTFIPPNNKISHGSLLALERAGIPVVSAEGNGDFDYDAQTYKFFEKQFVHPDEIIRECDKSFEEKGVCIIMVHPQDYVGLDGKLDEEKYKNYVGLLDRLRGQGVSFVTMEDIIDSEGKFYPYKGKLPIAQESSHGRPCTDPIRGDIVPGGTNNASEVRALQVALKHRAGFSDLAITGVYDDATLDAVVEVQEKGLVPDLRGVPASQLSVKELGNKLYCGAY